MWICDHFSARSIPSSPGPWVPGIKLGILYVLSYGKLWGTNRRGLCIPATCCTCSYMQCIRFVPRRKPLWISWLIQPNEPIPFGKGGHFNLQWASDAINDEFQNESAIPSAPSCAITGDRYRIGEWTSRALPDLEPVSYDGKAEYRWNCIINLESMEFVDYSSLFCS